jgi:hypothetical protein
VTTTADDAVTEFRFDNIGDQRSKFDVIATILHICFDGSLKIRV